VHRTLLECRTTGGCEEIALNDIVIKTVDQSRMATLKVSSHGRLINSYRCDGLILATPTGSTAYNLAAGGALIHPDSSVFAITPICPHTLSNRTVIVPGDSVIEVDNEEKNAALNISVDGVPFQPTCTSFPITACISKKTLPLIQPKGLSHFELLRTKLNWE
jgi:NAD+ kinase